MKHEVVQHCGGVYIYGLYRQEYCQLSKNPQFLAVICTLCMLCHDAPSANDDNE